ncbi:M16 family metallopeptidase [Vannielia litorea]|uniref:M16 family metallopeptidase n=1 Tax=Vannielia litorea TaxID=1217970 RepID=UPI001BD0E77A|nr:pitrilysin family protein [Vannielia litorea]MBS8227493.1 insulinase family protein [Vannielia litorea]
MHPIRRAGAALAAALAFTALPAAAEEVTTFSLENGMDVVVIEDHRAPVVVNMVWYRTGAADEPPGKSGIAHFLEHLLFQGTDDLAPGEFSRVVEANGGSDNAFTSWDYTGYFQRVAADRLELMMQMEADRMVDLLITPEDVATELQVILEERNQRVENDPSALFGEDRRAAQWMNHPYGIPIIGWKHEMEELTRQDALDFYKLYYSPNNAILVVAGDVQPDEVKRLAETHFGPLPANPALKPRARPQEPPQRAPRHLDFEDPRISQPYVVRTYLAPERDSGAQEKAAALTFLAELMGGSPTLSLMGRMLQFEESVAVYSAAFYSGDSLDDGQFGFYVVPVPGRSLEEAEADMDRVIETFLEEGVDMEAFERIKMQLRASEIYAKDNLQRLARRYGEGLTTGLTVEDIQAWPEVLQAVTPDDVMAVAREVLDMRNSVTGHATRPDLPTAEPASAPAPEAATEAEEISQ